MSSSKDVARKLDITHYAVLGLVKHLKVLGCVKNVGNTKHAWCTLGRNRLKLSYTK